MTLLLGPSDLTATPEAPASSGEALLRRVLDGLGGDCDEIAFNLFDNGYRGQRDDPSGCPVANYLQFVLGGNVLISACDVEWLAPDGLHRVTPGYHVAAFIQRFDAGQYPHLDADAVGA